jgi:hypothetical protein
MKHSLLLAHDNPLPFQPTLHAHVNEPLMSVHAALLLQIFSPKVHSLKLLQVTPLPLQPALQLQVNEPVLSEQLA